VNPSNLSTKDELKPAPMIAVAWTGDGFIVWPGGEPFLTERIKDLRAATARTPDELAEIFRAWASWHKPASAAVVAQGASVVPAPEDPRTCGFDTSAALAQAVPLSPVSNLEGEGEVILRVGHGKHCMVSFRDGSSDFVWDLELEIEPGQLVPSEGDRVLLSGGYMTRLTGHPAFSRRVLTAVRRHRPAE